ncbi:hypothetical protein M432DRAFT_637436 [Thermoascus aurantiacus ATCC 26904]
MRRQWKLFSRYLHCMKLPDAAATASVARPIYRVPDRLVAEAKLLCHEKPKRKDIFPKDPALLIEFIQTLAKLAEITGQEALPSPRPYGDSIEGGPLDRPIRFHLQDCWTRSYATSNERAKLHAREIHAQRVGDQGERQRILAEKRNLQKKVLHDCIKEQLEDFKKQLQPTIETAIQDLEDTVRLYTIQLSTLLEEVVTPADVVLDIVNRRNILAAKLVPIFDQLGEEFEELQMVLKSMRHSSRSTLTRMNRLRATDVEKGYRRETDKRLRLTDPGAIVYVLKVGEDVQEMQASTRDALQSIADIGRGLALMEDLILDEWVSLKMLGRLAAALSVREGGGRWKQVACRLLHILRAYGPSFIPLPAAIRRRREDGGPTALWAAALPTRSSN